MSNCENPHCTSVFKSKEEDLKISFTYTWIKLINELEKEANAIISKLW